MHMHIAYVYVHACITDLAAIVIHDNAMSVTGLTVAIHQQIVSIVCSHAPQIAYWSQ